MIPMPRDKDFFIQAAICIFWAVLVFAGQLMFLTIARGEGLVIPGVLLANPIMLAFAMMGGLAISVGRLTRHYEKRFEEMSAEIQRLSAGAESLETVSRETV